MRKRRLFLVAGACAAALSLAVGSVAFADPVGPPIPRPLPGVGSDTTQDVMNGYTNGVAFSVPAFGGIVDGAGNRTLGSYDATGPTPITYRNAPPECVNVNIRPNGSNQGVNSLRGIAPPAGPFPQQCVDWARSSANTSAARAGQNLTFIPYATDVVTYSTLANSTVSKNLSLTQLRSIFRANQPNCLNHEPVVPQSGSGTFSFWNSLVGPFGTCVNATVPTPPQEHDGRALSRPRQIMPYGVAQWITQSQQPAILDRTGSTVLRSIDGRYSLELNAANPGSRQVYNVLKNENLPGGAAPIPALADAFIGAGSGVCSNPQVLAAYGLKPIPPGDPNPCGSTTIVTPPN